MRDTLKLQNVTDVGYGPTAASGTSRERPRAVSPARPAGV